MSTPGSSQPKTSSLTRNQTKITLASIGLAIVALVTFFLPNKSFTSEFLYGVRPVLINSFQSVASSFTSGVVGLTEIDIQTFNWPVLGGFIALSVAGIVLLSRRKTQKAGGSFLIVAGALTAGMAGFGMTRSAEDLIADGIDVNDLDKFTARAVEYGTLTVEPGAYLAIAAGAALIGLGLYALIRPVAPASNLTAGPGPVQPQGGQQPIAQFPGAFPHGYGPNAHGGQFPPQPPAFPGE